MEDLVFELGYYMLLAFGIFSLVLWVWMLVEAFTEPRTERYRHVWRLVTLLTGPLGGFIYLFVRRPQHQSSGTPGEGVPSSSTRPPPPAD